MSARPESGRRGEAVVREVLTAARDELATVGYRALRIEDVATRAKVHKTTVYRRWPTKPELIHDAMDAVFVDIIPLPDTGALRSDLLALARGIVSFMSSTSGHCLIRMLMSEAADSEVRGIIESIRRSEEDVPRRVVAAAVARGELRDAKQGEMLMTHLVGGLHHEIFAFGRVPAEAELEARVDLLLYGALSNRR